MSQKVICRNLKKEEGEKLLDRNVLRSKIKMQIRFQLILKLLKVMNLHKAILEH